MPPTETTEKTSKAGISTALDGQRVIASSTRADGSVRKEIRVRPGYKPPEDVEVYKNRTAEAWKSRGSNGVPGAAAAEQEVQKSAAAMKNAKRKEARKKAAATGTGVHAEGSDIVTTAKVNEPAVKVAEAAAPVPSATDIASEREKEARKLTKKLRQARELSAKKEKGDVLLPEQFEKVIKINELIRQLEVLGFDSNGEVKNSESKD